MVLLLLLYQRRQRNKRILNDIQNPIDFMDDDQLIHRYRIDRKAIFKICEMSHGKLEDHRE